jgi:hypothetical protein
MKQQQARLAFHLLGLAVGILILFVLVRLVGIREFVALLAQLSYLTIAAAVVIYGVSWFFRTWRLGLMTRAMGSRIRFSDLFKLHISGYALNVVLPGKLGDVATVGYLKLFGMGGVRALALILQTRILDLFAVNILLLAFWIAFAPGTAPAWFSIFILVSFAVSVSPLLLALDKKRLLSRLLLRDFRNATVKRVAAKVNELYLSFHQALADKRQLLATAMLSTVIWFIEGLTCYVIAVSMAAPISLPQCVMAVCVGNISKIVSITPGGVGIYESFMVATLGMNGIALKQAVAISILDQLIKKGFNLALGLPATTAIGMNVGKLFRSLSRGAKKE